MKLNMMLLVLMLCCAPVFSPAVTTKRHAIDRGALTENQVAALVSRAQTPSEHLQLAQHYRVVAAAKRAEAHFYYRLAESYLVRFERFPAKGPLAGKNAEDCGYLADSLYEASKAALDLAADHERLAAGVL